MGKIRNDSVSLIFINDTGSIFICNKASEMQFKIVHHLHCTPYILNNKINPQSQSARPKCKSIVGTQSHMFWYRPSISQFWNKVQRKLETILIILDVYCILIHDYLTLESGDINLAQKLLLIGRSI